MAPIRSHLTTSSYPGYDEDSSATIGYGKDAPVIIKRGLTTKKPQPPWWNCLGDSRDPGGDGRSGFPRVDSNTPSGIQRPLCSGKGRNSRGR